MLLASSPVISFTADFTSFKMSFIGRSFFASACPGGGGYRQQTRQAMGHQNQQMSRVRSLWYLFFQLWRSTDVGSLICAMHPKRTNESNHQTSVKGKRQEGLTLLWAFAHGFCGILQIGNNPFELLTHGCVV